MRELLEFPTQVVSWIIHEIFNFYSRGNTDRISRWPSSFVVEPESRQDVISTLSFCVPWLPDSISRTCWGVLKYSLTNHPWCHSMSRPPRPWFKWFKTCVVTNTSTPHTRSSSLTEVGDSCHGSNNTPLTTVGVCGTLVYSVSCTTLCVLLFIINQ